MPQIKVFFDGDDDAIEGFIQAIEAARKPPFDQLRIGNLLVGACIRDSTKITLVGPPSPERTVADVEHDMREAIYANDIVLARQYMDERNDLRKEGAKRRSL